MSAGFTPGPWWVPETAPLAINSNPHNIATTHFVNGEANARLIAAAPELYAVCDMIAKGASGRMIREPLIAALAKARGQ